MNEIICGDCLQIMKRFPKNSIDFILTDPPYGLSQKEIEGDNSFSTYKQALPLMYNLLKDNKWFITFAPIGALYDFIGMTQKFFEYVWIGFIYYRNIQRILHNPLGRSKISLYLVFKKGEAKRNYHIRDVQEFVYDSINRREFCHPAQKPLEPLVDLIKFGSKKGNVVLDPFVGSGTTCIGAKKLGRRYIGIEINEEYYKTAIERINKTELPLTSFHSSLRKTSLDENTDK